MGELSFVSTDDLLKELLIRFDHAVFMGRKDRNGNKDMLFYRKFMGDAHLCMGMSHDLIDYISSSIEEDEDLESEDR